MECCISSKVTKFFVKVVVLITIFFLVRVESYKSHTRKDQDIPEYPLESSVKRKKPYFKSSLNTISEPEASKPVKPLPRSSRINTPKPVVEYDKWIEAPHLVTNFLSPSTLSQTDPFQYLLREVSKIEGNWKIRGLAVELDARLKTNEIPESVMPYARALETVIAAVNYLQDVKRCSKGIRNNQRITIPPEVSSPPELSSYGLFSSDIFADPEVPSRIVNKLMEIPKSEIPDLIIQLQDYEKMMEKWFFSGVVFSDYKWYANTLKTFLKTKSSLLDDLKRSMAEIHHLSDLNQNSTTRDQMNGEISSLAT